MSTTGMSPVQLKLYTLNKKLAEQIPLHYELDRDAAEMIQKHELQVLGKTWSQTNLHWQNGQAWSYLVEYKMGEYAWVPGYKGLFDTWNVPQLYF